MFLEGSNHGDEMGVEYGFAEAEESKGFTIEVRDILLPVFFATFFAFNVNDKMFL